MPQCTVVCERTPSRRTVFQKNADYETVHPVAGIPQYCENEGERVFLDIKEAKCFTCWCRVSEKKIIVHRCTGTEDLYMPYDPYGE
jgi:hypothetical protein